MNKLHGFSCAIIGASGMVGGMFIKILEERGLPISQLSLYASARSAGQTLLYKGEAISIQELTPSIFSENKFDVALFAVDSNISQEYAPLAAKSGCIVVDNSSAWRMDTAVPLIVPEVNAKDLPQHNGIIANPNCCATPAVVALKPLLDSYGLERVVISTYQSVSGAGVGGITDLERTNDNEEPIQFPHKIAKNLIPHIDSFLPCGYTGEEKKLMEEVQKILHCPTLPITATTVRVPVDYGHSLSINVTLTNDFDLEDVRSIFANAPGVVLYDDTANNVYPMPIIAAGTDSVYIGRLRRDNSYKNSLNMWVVADNIRKGAATNAVQIVEALVC